MLASQALGTSTDAPRLVLAHGFTQNARCWGEFGEACSQRFDVLAVDAPGHGWSGADTADLNEAGDLIVAAGGPSHYVGYSMGGRMLLHAALRNTIGEIRSLVLIGATAGIESDAERAERRALDAERAAQITAMGTRAFVEQWLAMPMFAHLTDEQSAKERRFENAPEGLAASLLHCGTGMQEPLWDQLSDLSMPVLVIAGTKDNKFTSLGQRIAAEIGSNASFVAVEGGHAVHLENPLETAEVIASWYSDTTTAR